MDTLIFCRGIRVFIFCERDQYSPHKKSLDFLIVSFNIIFYLFYGKDQNFGFFLGFSTNVLRIPVLLQFFASYFRCRWTPCPSRPLFHLLNHIFKYLFIYFQDDNLDSGYDLKQKLYKHWLDVYNISGGNDFHSSRQRLFFSLCEYSQSDFHKCLFSVTCQLCNISSI